MKLLFTFAVMEQKAISVSEYHEKIGGKVSKQAITKAIRNNRPLPYIDRYEKVGNIYVLYHSKIILKNKRKDLVV